MSEASAPLRISVWRGFKPKRTLVARDLENNGHKVMDLDNLQEEVYIWQTSESPFDGIADESVRLRLRDHLMDRLDASHPPSERGIDVLDEFIVIAEEAIASGGAEWTASQSQTDDDEDTADQVNSLLALTLHFKWLSGCFADRPGISVSVR